MKTPGPSDGNEVIELQAVTFEALVPTGGLRFAPPLMPAGTDRAGYEHWWRQLEFVFDLADPRSYPPHAPTALTTADKRVVDRYANVAKDLALSRVLNEEVSLTVRPHDAGTGEDVDIKVPPSDAVHGYAVLFRQMYAVSEKASYQRVRALLSRDANNIADSKREERRSQLEAWHRAISALQRSSLRQLVMEKLGQDGIIAAPPTGRSLDPKPPDTIIREYLYGDLIHWDRHAETVDDRKNSEFDDAYHRFYFLEATAGLAHLYIGFSKLSQRALR